MKGENTRKEIMRNCFGQPSRGVSPTDMEELRKTIATSFDIIIKQTKETDIIQKD